MSAIDPHQLAVELAALLADRQAPASLLDADQAGEFLNVPPSWCLAEARAGRLPHLKVGKYTRYRRQDLEDWIDRRSR